MAMPVNVYVTDIVYWINMHTIQHKEKDNIHLVFVLGRNYCLGEQCGPRASCLSVKLSATRGQCLVNLVPCVMAIYESGSNNELFN